MYAFQFIPKLTDHCMPIGIVSENVVVSTLVMDLLPGFQL